MLQLFKNPSDNNWMNNATIAVGCDVLMPHLNERQQRLAAAAEARRIGRGGVTAVSRQTGLSRPAIYRGLAELDQEPLLPVDRCRRPGGGRKRLEVKMPAVVDALKALLEPSTIGDPERVLLWTCKSTRTLAAELKLKGFEVSHSVVNHLLKAQNYSLQTNVKNLAEGKPHPDRNAQFEYIHGLVKDYLKEGLPVLSIDAKKKELVGPYRNPGRTYRKRGLPEAVRAHDFKDKNLGHAIPYGLYDVGRNTGWVNVGCDHNTAAFAVASLRRWWQDVGLIQYPKAKQLLLCADAGGNNGYRSRSWKAELQKLCVETGLEVSVCHLPPGTSKWNKIEHRLFAHISMNWRGQPLVSHEVILKLIAGTQTRTGLSVTACLDRSLYPLGVKVTDKELKAVNLHPHSFHGEWNYDIQAP
jgi:hypothetical protein